MECYQRNSGHDGGDGYIEGGEVISATVEDTTTVTRVVGVELEANEAKFGAPLEEVTYTHVLTNMGNYTDTYTIETESGPGWEVDDIDADRGGCVADDDVCGERDGALGRHQRHVGRDDGHGYVGYG